MVEAAASTPVGSYVTDSEGLLIEADGHRRLRHRKWSCSRHLLRHQLCSGRSSDAMACSWSSSFDGSSRDVIIPSARTADNQSMHAGAFSVFLFCFQSLNFDFILTISAHMRSVCHLLCDIVLLLLYIVYRYYRFLLLLVLVIYLYLRSQR